MVKEYLGGFIPGENAYNQGDKKWYLSTLVDACKGLPILQYDLMSIDLNVCNWKYENWSFDTFLYHLKRIEEADDSYPIILTPWGYICDGWHRVAKAIMAGKTHIDCYRLVVMPDAD